MNRLNKIPNENSSAPTMALFEKKNIEKIFSRHINRGQVQYLKAGYLDVLETHRKRSSFTDPVSGRQMLDCFSSAGCFNVGRRNPVVIEALNEALEKYDMGSYHLLSESKLALGKRLAALAPGDLNKVFFASGGGDAIDCALKLARGATGKTEIISTIKAYHGHTGFALSANGKEHYRKYFEPLMPGFIFTPFNDLKAMQEAITDNTAAIIVEPVQGEAGIHPATNEYLHGLREICTEKEILLIFDEVQTGFGRTGKFFAAEHSGVVPDIMATAKSIGGGIFPNGAVIYRETPKIAEFLRRYPNFHPTYSGGSDLGCHVSLRVIDHILDAKLCEASAKHGVKIKEALEKLKEENPKIIKEVRGVGMMVGIEYIHEFLGPLMSQALAKEGVFAAYSGNAPQVMRFMLPLAATENDVDYLIKAVRNAVNSLKIILPVALPAARIPGVLKLLNNETLQTVISNWIRSLESLFKMIRLK